MKMKKRQKNKNNETFFRKMLNEADAEVYDFQKEHRQLEKISVEEDLNILFGVMHNEFDDAPDRRWMADHILYDYAWWFIIENYFERKNIQYEKVKTENTLTYQYDGNTISVNTKGDCLVVNKNK